MQDDCILIPSVLEGKAWNHRASPGTVQACRIWLLAGPIGQPWHLKSLEKTPKQVGSGYFFYKSQNTSKCSQELNKSLRMMILLWGCFLPPDFNTCLATQWRVYGAKQRCDPAVLWQSPQHPSVILLPSPARPEPERQLANERLTEIPMLDHHHLWWKKHLCLSVDLG